jgi:hypothetical protein
MKENKCKSNGKQKCRDKRENFHGVSDQKSKQPFLDSTEPGKLGRGRDDSFTEEGSYPVNNPLPY